MDFFFFVDVVGVSCQNLNLDLLVPRYTYSEMCQPVLCGSTYCFIGYHWFGGVLYKEKTDLGVIPCTTNKMIGFQYKLCINDTFKTYGGM